jgi:hypothetical protein
MLNPGQKQLITQISRATSHTAIVARALDSYHRTGKFHGATRTEVIEYAMKQGHTKGKLNTEMEEWND